MACHNFDNVTYSYVYNYIDGFMEEGSIDQFL